MGNEKDLGTKKRQLQTRCSLLSSRAPKVCAIFCLFQVSISFMKSVIIKRQTIRKRSFYNDDSKETNDTSFQRTGETDKRSFYAVQGRRNNCANRAILISAPGYSAFHYGCRY